MDDEQNFRIRRSQPEMLPQIYEMLRQIAGAFALAQIQFFKCIRDTPHCFYLLVEGFQEEAG